MSFVVGIALCLGIGYSMEDKSEPSRQSSESSPTQGVQVADTYPPSLDVEWIDIDCHGLRNKAYTTVERKLHKLGVVSEKALIESSDVKEGYVVDVPCQAKRGSVVKVKVAQRPKATNHNTPPTDPRRTPAYPTPAPTQQAEPQENPR
ncbi:MAG: hypothetical protein H0T78_12045 [Longispora sp.]|nr:hypothetical protein [Longispora sp. (in: high G+C Gram-positive bacteria)]